MAAQQGHVMSFAPVVKFFDTKNWAIKREHMGGGGDGAAADVGDDVGHDVYGSDDDEAPYDDDEQHWRMDGVDDGDGAYGYEEDEYDDDFLLEDGYDEGEEGAMEHDIDAEEDGGEDY